ncbi:hypothetical protein B0H14DRAFT_2562093 [Mycena olivaceomarginata]|nr:hypothetical protein B0H14DRAFT_2562093 [Mycena olivaceomarginata]
MRRHKVMLLDAASMWKRMLGVLENVKLPLKDIDGGYITISIPVEYCRSWQSFCNYLITREDIKAVAYLKAGWQFVLRRDDTGILSKETWEAWISSFGYHSHPYTPVELCIVRDSEQCCVKPAENADGFCDNCGMQYLEDDPSSLPEPAQETIINRTVAPLMLAEPSVPNMACLKEKLMLVKEDSIPPTIHTLISKEEENIGQLHDRPPSLEEVQYPPHRFGQLNDPDGSRTRHYLCAAYRFIIAPPFVHDKVTWDEPRLQNRLNALQGVVSAGNFALLVCFYTTSMVLRIGDCRKEFSKWFLVCRRMSIVYLILYSQAFISLVSSLIALLLQISVHSIQNLESYYSPGQNTTANAPNTPTPNVSPSSHISTDLSIVQSVVFWGTLIFSGVYTYMIHAEIKRSRQNIVV